MAIVTIAIGIATITSLLAGAISMSSGIARDTIRAKYGKQLNEVAKKISPRLNENEQLRSQINTALTNQNQKLASDLLMASPLSSVVKRLKENIQLNEKGSQETDRYFDEQKDLAEQAQGAADKISSALDGDVAAATEGKHA